MSVCLFALSISSVAAAATTAPGNVKLAFFNIQSGKGERGLSGRPVLFADTQNCTDTTQPVNAWGVGFVQEALRAALADDPSVLALGLAEAWVCGSPENVRRTLGWAAKTATHNGVAVVARYGFAGPEVWQQLDTSQNPDPSDTMWVVRVPVCVDPSCTASIVMYAAHWYGTGTYKKPMYDKQALQTIDFMRSTAGDEPHALLGDLNAWEGSVAQCGQNPINAGIPKMRAAGYVDAWPLIHGGAEGFTGMTNRSGCGSPMGYTWKRIDYAWSTPDFAPLDITRFAMPLVPGDAAASDHYGIIATYPRPDSAAPLDVTPPAVQIVAPANEAVVSGMIAIDIAAWDDVGVSRVDVLENGVVRHTLPAGATRVSCDTRSLANGATALQARAYDATGNVTLSAALTINVQNAIAPPVPPPALSIVASEDIVIHARRATTVAGTWQVKDDATAAGGASVSQPNANAAKLTSPLAQPAHFFEVPFVAEPGVAYRLWIRGRAERDSWGNDSVFVQFSGSVTAAGTATFRIGTTSATTVNLEDAADIGVKGWGWQDNGYGVGVLGTPIYFDGPAQTLRIQTREDGFAIDQIVLSPFKYMAGAPGPLVNDATILDETVVRPAARPRTEIVIRASQPASFGGSWRLVTDTTAADGVALTHPDGGLAKLTSPLAAPVHYVDLTFEAEQGRAYHLWIRGRADRDNWANDSVFVQFSGSVDGAGLPIYRIGTASATMVNLEEDTNKGVQGWGWQDNGYGTDVFGQAIVFETTGLQTIRLQTREDGLRFDQIVLSSATYVTTPPGPMKNDSTILP